MDPVYISAFAKTTRNLFDTMLSMPVNFGEPAIKGVNEPSFDVSGIIGFTGDVEGTVVLSFPLATAKRVVSVFTGTDVGDDQEGLTDAIGELVNMIAGGAKAQFSGKKVSISCPSVVLGSNHVVHNRKDAVCISIPCSTDCGDFTVEFAIRNAESGANAATAGAAAAA